MTFFTQAVDELQDEMRTQRRDLHRFAETGWVEFRTASHVAQQLHQLGYHLALG